MTEGEIAAETPNQTSARPLRVAMISDYEGIGGAAIAAGWLSDALAGLGHEVVRLTLNPDGAEHTWTTVPLSRRGARDRIVNRLSSQSARKGRAERQLRRMLGDLKPDVLNVHNLHGGTGYGWSVAMAEAAGTTPVVWTLHDMWSFTGRCAYNYDCRLFESGCDTRCPTPLEYPQLAPPKIRPAWEMRGRVMSRRLGWTAVAPSRWMAREASLGHWRGHRLEIIPNGLPDAAFEPVDHDFARRTLGIEARELVVVIAAQDLSERRKGGAVLKEALQQIPETAFTLVTVGKDPPSVNRPNVREHHLGSVSDSARLAMAYAAGDLLVHPAPADNLPNVVLEALARGTPVLALPVGGLPDMVRPGITGWLARGTTAAALATELQHSLGELARGTDLRESCRRVAWSEYTAALQASRYAQLFHSLRAVAGP